MISEKEFATGFAGFWSECTPFLTPQSVAELNLRHVVLKDRSGRLLKPLQNKADKSSNDFVAETAFELFATSIKCGKDVLAIAEDRNLFAEIAANSTARLIGLANYWRAVKQNYPVSPTEEAVTLASRLEDRFSLNIENQDPVVQPQFRGCGMLNSCFGDIFASKTLYEVKTVDRNLRSMDIRQVLIYSCLNYHSLQYEIETVSILNPRKGVEYSFRLDWLVERIAKKTTAEFFHQMADFLYNFEEQIHHPA